MGRTPVDGTNKGRKSSVHMTSTPFMSNDAAGHHSLRQHDSDSSTDHFSGISNAEGQLRRQNDPPLSDPSMNEGCASLHHHNEGASELMSIWNESTTRQYPTSSPLALLDSMSNEVRSPGFDPLISDFDDIDFSYIDDSQFETDRTSEDLSLPQLVSSQHSRASLSRHQPGQPQQISTTQFLSTSNSSRTSSYQSSNSSQANTPQPLGADLSFWTAQLEEISHRTHNSPIPLDEMLHHSSRLLPRVNEALRAFPPADSSPFPTHIMLILICLTQTIALFEQCIPSVICGSNKTGPSGDLPLHLGAFQVDREVQQALQMHVVGKELATILKMTNIIKQMLLRPEWNGICKHTHRLLLEDLQARTKTLVHQMKQKWISARRFAL
ncbi:hypothetical protein TruAng_011887 [Truncatella angustata]|nr:hypothetical protein TruAng_011887 [Truncatella angustata]